MSDYDREYIQRHAARALTQVAQDRDRLSAENERLRTAIRAHRDKRGNDRCWIDDHELYAALGEPFGTHTKTLPCREEFLESCSRYWRQRQPTDAPITEHPPDPGDMSDPATLTIGQLERENERLRAEIERLTSPQVREIDMSVNEELIEERDKARADLAEAVEALKGLIKLAEDLEEQRPVTLWNSEKAVMESARAAIRKACWIEKEQA